jgi:hypothetical protein
MAIFGILRPLDALEASRGKIMWDIGEATLLGVPIGAICYRHKSHIMSLLLVGSPKKNTFWTQKMPEAKDEAPQAPEVFALTRRGEYHDLWHP